MQIDIPTHGGKLIPPGDPNSAANDRPPERPLTLQEQARYAEAYAQHAAEALERAALPGAHPEALANTLRRATEARRRADGLAWQQLETEAIGILAACAPCQQAPIRIVPVETVPPFAGERFCDAFTQVNSDVIARPFMADPPPGRFICLCYSRTKFGEWGISDPATFRRHVLAVFLHELAHALQWNFAGFHRRPMSAADVEADENKIAASGKVDVSALNDAEIGDLQKSLLEMHDDVFLRAALHLRHRAEKLGVRLTPGMIIGTRRGQSHPDAYQRALGSEPAEMIGLPFERIFAADPPAGFSELVTADEMNPFNPPPFLGAER